MGVGVARPGFGPEVGHVGRRAAELEADQMIEFVTAQKFALKTVSRHLLAFDPVGHRDRRPHGRGVAASADGCVDRGDADAWVGGAGGTRRVGPTRGRYGCRCEDSGRHSQLPRMTTGVASRRSSPPDASAGVWGSVWSNR